MDLSNNCSHINRYLTKLDAVDSEGPEIRKVTASELEQKIASMKEEMQALEGRKAEERVPLPGR